MEVQATGKLEVRRCCEEGGESFCPDLHVLLQELTRRSSHWAGQGCTLQNQALRNVLRVPDGTVPQWTTRGEPHPCRGGSLKFLLSCPFRNDGRCCLWAGWRKWRPEIDRRVPRTDGRDRPEGSLFISGPWTTELALGPSSVPSVNIAM